MAKLLRARITLALTIAIVGLAACKPKCFFRDSVTVLDQNGDIYLVLRAAGVQEKVFTYELYNTEPAFDSCAKAKVQPIAKEVYDDSEGRLKGVQGDANGIRIIYTGKPEEAIKVDEVKLRR
jgi:hypothetical protein